MDRGQNHQDLVDKSRTLCKKGVERALPGGRGPNLNNYGPTYTIEAVGGNRFPPKVEAGPDPTGVESLQLAWTICPSGGVIGTCSVGHGQGATVTFPAEESLVGETFPLDRTRDALQVAADRTAITGVVTIT